MASWKLAKGYVSYRWVTQHWGFNFRHIENLVACGILESEGRGVAESSLARLVEGEHYVVCAECGARAGALTGKHLKTCSGITLRKYCERHVGSQIDSGIVQRNRKKTEEQKHRQSEVLKARFQTPEGQVTRRQISEAAKASMAAGYRHKAARHLRALNASPSRRAAISAESKRRWASGDMECVARWHRENRAASNEAIARARGHIRRTFSKPHSILEGALRAAGIPVEREYRVGFYRLDEAIPEVRLGIEVDGCYWHGCRACGFPGVAGTRVLDRRKTTYLRKSGWQIVRIRECAMKRDLASCVKRVLKLAKENGYGRAA